MCVARQAQCAAHPKCVAPLLIFHCGLVVGASRPPCAPRALVYVPCHLEICPPYSNSSSLALFSSTMPLSSFSLSQWLSFGSKQIYIGFQKVGFIFFFFETPLSNVWVLHFSLTFKTLCFSFFLWNFGSHDKIFGFSLRGLCDWASGFEIHDCIWKCQLSIFGKFCHSWPCLIVLQNRVLKKSQCLLRWWWSFLNCRCIRSPSGLHGLFWTCFSRTKLMNF